MPMAKTRRIYRSFLHRLVALGDAFGHPWRKVEAMDRFSRREYKDYADYVRHQSSKLSKLDLADYDTNFAKALTARLKRLAIPWQGKSVLCLGARTGAECRAFIELGCFAVGVDLNPGVGNRNVLTGDFHDLQFADRSVDCVFTNSLDHALDLRRLTLEAKRVLKPDGLMIAEIVYGSNDAGGREPGTHESLWWAQSADVVDVLCRAGFQLKETQEFVKPFRGVQAVLTL
jgi:SAM-dependent methyltransferase